MQFHPYLVMILIFLGGTVLFAVTVFVLIRSSWNRRARPPKPVPMLLLTRTNKGRAAALSKAGNKLKMHFEEQSPQAVVEELQDFVLFSQGSRKTIFNRLIGSTAGCRIEVFDYIHDGGPGGSNSEAGAFFSIVLLKTQAAAFPQFDLRPTTSSAVIHGGLGQWRPLARLLGTVRTVDESLFGTVPSQVKNFARVEFPERRRFGELYLVHAADPEKVRPLFSREVVSYFEGDPAVHIEANDGTFIYWRGDQMLDGDPRRSLGYSSISEADVRDLLREALEAFRVLARNQRRTPT